MRGYRLVKTPRSRRLVFGAIALGALLGAPWVLDAYTISIASRSLIFGLLAISVNLLTGVSGLPSLGQAAYFGVGAYTAAILARTTTDVGLVQITLAAVIAAATAAITGAGAVRARGAPFLMITFAIGELGYQAAGQWRGVTNGTDGLSGIPAVVPFWGMSALVQDGLVYYYVLAHFLVLFGAASLLVRAPFGLALRGMRDNEARMGATGYPVGRYLLVAYSLAGALAGAAGALWVSVQQFIAPSDIGFEVSALALLAVAIGGMGSMWGSCAGAALVVFTRDELAGHDPFVGHGLLLLGLLFVLVVYLLPRGVAAGCPRRRTHRLLPHE
ncbi:MAG: branched-chain amino acid ABC transporter permease [Thermomicrobiales bacterium]